MTTRTGIRLVGSDHKGTRVLFLVSNLALSETIEARSELDPELQRVELYAASSLSAARDLTRRHGCELAIYADGVDGADFVAIQLQLKHANPNIELIPLVEVPTVAQLRESKRVGGVVDFESLSVVVDYDSLKRLLLNYLRERRSRDTQVSEVFAFTSALQSCLLVGHDEHKQAKAMSAKITAAMVARYDFSTSENTLVLAAERLFVPWVSPSKYVDILPAERASLVEILSQCGSWGQKSSAPASSKGFVVTTANYLAERLAQGEETETLIETVQKRPAFLKHPSIRVLNKEVLSAVLASSLVESGGDRKYAAS